MVVVVEVVIVVVVVCGISVGGSGSRVVGVVLVVTSGSRMVVEWC